MDAPDNVRDERVNLERDSDYWPGRISALNRQIGIQLPRGERRRTGYDRIPGDRPGIGRSRAAPLPRTYTPGAPSRQDSPRIPGAPGSHPHSHFPLRIPPERVGEPMIPLPRGARTAPRDRRAARGPRAHRHARPCRSRPRTQRARGRRARRSRHRARRGSPTGTEPGSRAVPRRGERSRPRLPR